MISKGFILLLMFMTANIMASTVADDSKDPNIFNENNS